MSISIRNIPWITDGANDFLFQKVSSKTINSVLEFGSGASTVWFAENVETLISVEHDREWHSKVTSIISDRGLHVEDYILLPRPYSSICNSYKDRLFDLVVVDGRDRVSCAEASYNLVRPGGYLMLDNDERASYNPIHNLLEGWEKTSYVQVGRDKTGWYAPHHWITTVWQRPDTLL